MITVFVGSLLEDLLLKKLRLNLSKITGRIKIFKITVILAFRGRIINWAV